ncbi:nitrilase-related carbon-nitrogen hydrolase [Agrobacterium vitis]|uniref:nitrilase-related carbon-nitrogen hydrolase n=1 Tax=Agrobacterium vitis TaxID=373 RepID=UPI001574A2A6|nr:nitrilase-related carbon-nitrogen hydrolase [Agrobacterium vitis]NSZ55535.1 D-N-carbamoylase [Agrobacterium vitis]NTA34786.1 D-N-carbamoylase [Agrobacterium vitis]
MTFRAAAVQLGPASATIKATLARILTLLDKAAEQKITLAVLPELALTPYFAATIHDRAAQYADKEENDAAISAITTKARNCAMTVILPFAEQNGNRIYNSMAFINSRGEHVGTFRKMHIPGFVEQKESGEVTILEKRYFAPGDNGFAVHDCEPWKLGGLICYDRRFPEAYRSLFLQGVDVICIGYNTPVMPASTLSASRHASELAMCGGAYSNGTYVVAAGKAGMEGGLRYIGGSVVIGPDGRLLSKAKTMGDELVVADIDLQRQQLIRDRWDFHANRRPDSYLMSAAV